MKKKQIDLTNLFVWITISLIIILSISIPLYLAYNKEAIKQKAKQKVINFKKNDGTIVKYLDYQEK